MLPLSTWILRSFYNVIAGIFSSGLFLVLQELDIEREVISIHHKKKKCSPAVRSKISSKLIFASCVCYSDRAYYVVCVPIYEKQKKETIRFRYSMYGTFRSEPA